jgi:hypothetical protein
MTFGGLPNLARLGHNAVSELSPLSDTSHTVRGAWENVHLAKTKIIEQPVRCLQPPPGIASAAPKVGHRQGSRKCPHLPVMYRTDSATFFRCSSDPAAPSEISAPTGGAR